jgi:hypothetical protein
MYCLFKSLVPFFLTLTLGVFIASFFVVLPAPKVEVVVDSSWSNGVSKHRCRKKKKRRHRHGERTIRQVEMKIIRLKGESKRFKIERIERDGKVRVIEMLEAPVPPPPPPAKVRNK